MAMPPPMVPAPTTAAARISTVGVSFGNAGDLGRFALGEEQADQVAGFGGEHAIGEQLDLARGAGVEAVLARRLAMASTAAYGACAPRAVFFKPARAAVKAAAAAAGSRDLGRSARATLRVSPRRGFRARESDGAGQQLAVHNLIDDPFRQRAFRADVLAQRAHFNGRGHAAKARQALRSASAGNDPQQHFGLSHLGGGHGHAIVAGHGELQAAAQRGAVDGADHRLGAILDAPQQRMHAMRAVDGNFAVRDGAEDFDIGAGDERVARADQHNGREPGDRSPRAPRPHRCLRHAGTERIHGRIVDGDDGNLIANFIVNEFGHGVHLTDLLVRGAKSIVIGWVIARFRAPCNRRPQTPPGPEGSNGSGLTCVPRITRGLAYSPPPPCIRLSRVNTGRRSFDDVVNQDHVKTTLGNAIAQKRIAHGYIFSGQRGTGKTTVARILARCLNCVQGPD